MMRGAAACGGTLPVTFSGTTFSQSAGTSTVTSATRTVTRAGTIKFISLGGDGTPEYSINGGAWTSITEALELSLALSDTLAVRATGLLSSEARTFSITSYGSLIEDVTLERT